MVLPACRSRSGVGVVGFACTHPRVRADGGFVTAAICASCVFREPPIDGDEVRAARDLKPLPNETFAQGEPQGEDQGETHVAEWAVGITTAPRNEPTLSTLPGNVGRRGLVRTASLRRARDGDSQ